MPNRPESSQRRRPKPASRTGWVRVGLLAVLGGCCLLACLLGGFLPLDRVAEEAGLALRAKPGDMGECTFSVPQSSTELRADLSKLVELLATRGIPLSPDVGASTGRPLDPAESPPAPASEGARAGPRVLVESTVVVRGSGLSLLPYTDRQARDSHSRGASMRIEEFKVPVLIVTDSTGLGLGWHLTVRIEKDPSRSALLNCLRLWLSEDGIRRVYGNANPISRLVRPIRPSLQDQLLAHAAPSTGMGMYLIAPVLDGLPTGMENRAMPMAPMVVCLIAGP